MNWKDYHTKRQRSYLLERSVRSIRDFSDAEKIALAELGAICYHPREKDGWDTRRWLESIYCVLHHGCCAGCKAAEKCKELSQS